MSNDFVYQLRENRERAEAAESALAELRARITALREEWSEAAEWEFNNSNIHEGKRLSQCVDELGALLVESPAPQEPKA